MVYQVLSTAELFYYYTILFCTKHKYDKSSVLSVVPIYQTDDVCEQEKV